ncbi:unnamed protein product [Caenorhabditis nigoni]
MQPEGSRRQRSNSKKQKVTMQIYETRLSVTLEYMSRIDKLNKIKRRMNYYKRVIGGMIVVMLIAETLSIKQKRKQTE